MNFVHFLSIHILFFQLMIPVCVLFKSLHYTTKSAAKICRNSFSSSVNELSGLVAIHKPAGWTSNDVVKKVKNMLLHKGSSDSAAAKQKKLKVGHGGALDPLAEGVLVIGVGEGTKKLEGFLSGSKKYRAIGKLGTETDTLDSSGTVTQMKPIDHITPALLASVIPHFCGNISQVPPMYSALKRNGVRLYDLARKGIVISREPRDVTVFSLQTFEDDRFKLPQYVCLEIECSGGFYVRSLIQDIAINMNSFGHMIKLIRTKQGPFELSDCLKQADWTYENIVSKLRYPNLHELNP